MDYNYKKQTISDLEALQKNSPGTFLNEITNLNQNIRRIESNIRRKKYKNDTELKSWLENLERSKIRQQIIEALITK